MILSRATQNAVWPTSLQPLVTMPSHLAGSIISAIEPTRCPFRSPRARGGSSRWPAPDAEPIYRRNPWPGQRAKTPRAAAAAALASPHDVVAGKKLRDFLLRRVRSVRAVHRILADR